MQFFPGSGNLIAAAAGSGLTGQPDWYLNLKAHPQAHAEVEGTADVRAEARRSCRALAARTGHRAALRQVPAQADHVIPLLPLVPPHGSRNAT